MRVLNTIASQLKPATIEKLYATAPSFNDKLQAKVDSVITNPDESARRIRASIRRGQVPYVTVKQLRVQWKIAARQNDNIRRRKIENVLDLLFQMEQADGYQGTLESALYYLENFVSPGAVMAAKADSLHHTYLYSDGKPFLCIPQVQKARSLAEQTEDADLFQQADDILGYLEAKTRGLLAENNSAEWVASQSSEAVLAHCHSGTESLFTA